jgi:hypothetical protein
MTEEFIMMAEKAYEMVEKDVMRAIVSKVFELDGIDPEMENVHTAEGRVGFSLLGEVSGHENCNCVICSDPDKLALSKLVVSIRMTMNGVTHGFMLDWGSCKLFCMDDETSCDMREEIVTGITGYVLGGSSMPVDRKEVGREIVRAGEKAFSKN